VVSSLNFEPVGYSSSFDDVVAGYYTDNTVVVGVLCDLEFEYFAYGGPAGLSRVVRNSLAVPKLGHLVVEMKRLVPEVDFGGYSVGFDPAEVFKKKLFQKNFGHLMEKFDHRKL
jgi:hypothetical protein